MDKKFFTLTELLAVTCVCCLMLGILIPVLANVQAQGKKSNCLDNLRIQGKGIAQFVNDNDGIQPGNQPMTNQIGFQSTYAYQIADYIEPAYKKAFAFRKKITHTDSVFLCPDDPQAISWWYPQSYSAVRQNLFPFHENEAPNLVLYGDVKNPAKIFAIMDGYHSGEKDPAGCNGIQPPIKLDVATGKYTKALPFTKDLNNNGINESGAGTDQSSAWYFNGAQPRHAANVNILFVDGHSAAVSEKEFVNLEHWQIQI